MKLLSKKVYLLYCAFFSIFVPVSAFLAGPHLYPNLLLILSFLPVTYYFVHKAASTWLHLPGGVAPAAHLEGVSTTVLTYYSFILLTILTIIGFLNIKSPADLPGALLFLPLFAYLIYSVVPRRTLPHPVRSRPLKKDRQTASSVWTSNGTNPAVLKVNQRQDPDRRMFLKLIGSAGLSMFFLSLFTKKAGAAFFGSVPGPGTVSLKDISGAQIDPAGAHPTDGYKIAQLDDASPSYYGFTNKSGAWFIMKEDSSGNYRYFKGTSAFSTNWTNRASLAYDYFDVIF